MSASTHKCRGNNSYNQNYYYPNKYFYLAHLS